MKNIFLIISVFSVATAAFGSSGFSVPSSARSETTVAQSPAESQSLFSVREMDFGVSTWSPDHFQSGFTRSSLPSAQAYAVFSRLSNQGFLSWVSPELGAGITQIERTGSMSYYGNDQAFTETAHVLSASLGARFESPYFDNKVFGVWQSVGVMPSLIFISKSAFNQGQIENALPVYGRLGLRVGSRSWPVQGVAGLEVTPPSIAAQNLQGVGAFGGAAVRF